jgi:flagellar hook protein FlgE
MALIRAMNSGVSGIRTHQARIDVIGDNLANVNTTGFKSGRALFQSLFNQTLSFGSAPTTNNGGINAMQVGLGVELGQITKDFAQGALDQTGIPSDLAIEGDGFFVLKNSDGSPVYSRDGAFARNISNKLVNPGTGYFVQGWNATQPTFVLPGNGAPMEDVEIPIGTLRISAQTTQLELSGNFDSDGNPLADKGSEISGTKMYVLGTTEEASALTDMRNVTMVSGSIAPLIVTANGTGIDGGNVSAFAAGSVTIDAGLAITAGTQYLLSIGKGAGVGQNISFDGAAYAGGVIDLTHASVTGDVTAGAFDTAVTAGGVNVGSVYGVQSVPSGGVVSTVYTPLTLSAKKGGADLRRLEGTEAKDMDFVYNTTGTNVQDFMNWMERTLGVDSSGGQTQVTGNATVASTVSTVVLDAETANTFEMEAAALNQRMVLKVIAGAGMGQSFVFNPTANYVAGTNTITNIGAAWSTDVLDATSVISIEDMTAPHDGRFTTDEPSPGTKLTQMITTAASTTNTSVTVDSTVLGAAVDTNFIHVGDIMRFTGNSGSSQAKMAIITDINRSTGVISFNLDGGANTSGLVDSVGATVLPPLGSTFDIMRPTGVAMGSDGVINVHGNQGGFNNITDMVIKNSTTKNTLMTFTQDGNANGESGRASFTAFDSTGNPKEVSVVFYLEGRTDSTTSLRWIAESPNDTDLNESVATAVAGGKVSSDNGRIIGGGRVTFDSNGQFISEAPTGSGTVTLDQVAGGAGASMDFTIDFSKITTLANGVTDINMFNQDGMPEGVLESFSVGVDGTVTGGFSNGATRSIARVGVGRFNNPQGLVSLGDNLFRIGPNSGSVQTGVAGTDGRGVIRGGALEASNVDLSRQFTDLIITQRGFQASARIISTADELLQELVNLKR